MKKTFYKRVPNADRSFIGCSTQRHTLSRKVTSTSIVKFISSIKGKISASMLARLVPNIYIYIYIYIYISAAQLGENEIKTNKLKLHPLKATPCL
jgi:hypothetical protein